MKSENACFCLNNKLVHHYGIVVSPRIVDMFPPFGPTLLPYFLYEVDVLLFWCVFIYVVVSNTIFIPHEQPILLEHPRFDLCCLILIFLCSALYITVLLYVFLCLFVDLLVLITLLVSLYLSYKHDHCVLM